MWENKGNYSLQRPTENTVYQCVWLLFGVEELQNELSKRSTKTSEVTKWTDINVTEIVHFYVYPDCCLVIISLGPVQYL